MSNSTIYYTLTDEAPALATYSFLPIVKAFTRSADISIETPDISLSGRIIAQFPERLEEDQRLSDALSELGELTKQPDANIIKLPNISASIPQLKAAISELQAKGYNLPDYPEEAKSPEEQEVKARYAKVLGSAVNPVLREGNSDRRVADAVKLYARSHPHHLGEWEESSKSRVATMSHGDYYQNELSTMMPEAGEVSIQFVAESGECQPLRANVVLQAGEVIDATVMQCAELREFYEASIQQAKRDGVLLSLHLKATMMKVSDPIMFGHAVSVYFADVFRKYAEVFREIGVDPRHGLGDVYTKIAKLEPTLRQQIEADIAATYEQRPELAMVNSDKGITNLHVPSDVIVDASIPAALKSSGKMWNRAGELQDTLAMIPDRSYSLMYQEVFEFCRQNGAFDVRTMGNVSNVGLMAQKAEEYGSHDKTFEMDADGRVQVLSAAGEVLMEHSVKAGDIWRMCQTKDLPIRDWVKLAVNRARITGQPAIFWLDEQRAHDAQLIGKVVDYLQDHDTDGLDIQIMSPVEAMRYTLKRMQAGENTISVTGNVLRDYLTDLFPILELGTSAKMLSIVPLLAGGGLFETGAGGSAPKHVQQLLEENHLRWDSLGEFLALAASLEDLAQKSGDIRVGVLAEALNQANIRILNYNRSPSRKVGEISTRGSHFFLAMYWARALADQDENPELKAVFTPIAEAMNSSKRKIIDELFKVLGQKVDLGGYYRVDPQLAEQVMRPSTTFNEILSRLL